MPLRLPRITGLASSSSQPFFNPSYSTLSRALSAPRPSRSYSSAPNSGRSNSRDGSERVKPANNPDSPSSSSSSRNLSTSPQRPTAPTAPAPPKLGARYVIPHATGDLVRADSFFATHRPLLELPVRLAQRRTTRQSTLPVQPAEEAELKVEAVMEHEGRTVRLEEDMGKDLARVVDLSEDGTPMGAPYLVRVREAEPLKSAEEELLAEEKAAAALEDKVELLHEQEAESSEPYDAWMIGQHEVQPASVARYLAVHPPFSTPSATLSPSSTPAAAPAPSRLSSNLAYLSPFTASPSSPSTAARPASAFPAFTDHFVAPLEPHESSALVDQFLSSAQMKLSWTATSDYIERAGEALRQAGQTYAGVDKATQEAFPLPLARQQGQQRGSILVWDQDQGFQLVDVAQNVVAAGESPFLPAELVDLDAADNGVSLDSVRRKRIKKVKKHKYRKRRKAQQALRKRLGH
ncbi:hypothetical protein JCM10207_003033 [Rhodosporidiobolus poonsookiae]